MRINDKNMQGMRSSKANSVTGVAYLIPNGYIGKEIKTQSAIAGFGKHRMLLTKSISGW